jgi:hypothetical protein
MRPIDQAISIAQQYRANSAPASYQGIVSPCSACLNQRINPTQDGRPGCPRRVAAYRNNEMGNAGVDASSMALTVLTGVNGLSDDGTLPLANPVYDTPSNSIMIWVATIKDNPPKVNANTGQVLSPGLLDPSFSTDWLVCQSLPVAPRDSEAQYFQKGALMEGDQVEIILAPQQQLTTDSNGNSQSLNIIGTASKVNFHSLFPRVPVNQTLVVPGT